MSALCLVLAPSVAQARSLTAEDAVALALENDLGISAAEAGERKSRADARQALLALFPSVTATGGYTRLGTVPYIDLSTMYGGSDTGTSTCDQIDESELPTGWTLEMAQAMCEMITGWMTPSSAEPIPMGLADNYFAGLKAEQVLFAGGAMHQARKAAGDFHAASEENVRMARQQAVYTAEQLFYGVLMARRAAEVTAQAQATVDAYVASLHALVEAGVAGRADLLAAQAQASQARLDAMRAAHGARLAEATMRAVLVLDDNEPLDLVVAEDFPTRLPAERERLVELARARRPELRQLDASLSALDHLSKASWASWLPAVVVQGNLQWRNPNYSLEQVWYRSADLTVAASWSLWDRGKGLFGHQSARASWSQLYAQRSQLDRMLAVEVQGAVTSFDESLAELEVARTGVERAEEALRLEQDRFEQGMVNNTELLAAQAAAAGARLAQLQAETGIHMAHAALRKAVGDDYEVRP
ncbi:MAG: TolC family protein [Pseudomonadota bacterium]